MVRCFSLIVALGVLNATTALASSSGYVYVAVPRPPCSAEPCAAAELLVFDAATTRLVTRMELPPGTDPVSMAISPDGTRLYVSLFGFKSPTGQTEIVMAVDMTRHAPAWMAVNSDTGTQTVTSGQLAVSADGSLLLIQGIDISAPAVFAFDVLRRGLLYPEGSVTAWTCCAGSRFYAAGGIASDPAARQLFVNLVFGGMPAAIIGSYDQADLGTTPNPAPVRELLIPGHPFGFSRARDGRLYQIVGPSLAGDRTAAVIDPQSMTVVETLQAGLAAGRVADAPSRGLVIAPGQFALWQLGTPSLPIRVTDAPTDTTGVAIPANEKYAFVTVRGPSPGGLNAVVALDLDTGRTMMTYPLRAAPGADLLVTTPAGAPACDYRLNAHYSSFAASGGTSAVQLTTDCLWHASSDAGWVRFDRSSGDGGAAISLTVDPWTAPPSGPYATRTATVTIGGQVVTITQAGAESQPPFGFVDTPADGAGGVTGSLAVTGWALDDVGVARVRVYRDAVAGESAGLRLVGNATFVEGARPDLQALFPSMPFAPRAGWGLMVLTNMLPNAGTGTYRLWVYAEDIEGRQALLGARTFTAANATAAVPFGAIDTPAPGESVSGVIVNWGWALTPLPATIPLDGSTIDVVVDGVVVGHPAYNLFRPDIAALFPAYANTSGPVGYFVLDTRTLTNGIHAIAWIVRDNLGRARGIGSRFFHVQNP